MAEQDGGQEEMADELMAEAIEESDTDLTEEREQGLGEQTKEAEEALGKKPDGQVDGDDDAAEPIVEEDESEETQGEQEAPELDSRLLHAAERMKWDADTISSFGDKAEDILGKVADGMDAVSEKYAELGRQEIERTAQAQEVDG